MEEPSSPCNSGTQRTSSTVSSASSLSGWSSSGAMHVWLTETCFHSSAWAMLTTSNWGYRARKIRADIFSRFSTSASKNQLQNLWRGHKKQRLVRCLHDCFKAFALSLTPALVILGRGSRVGAARRRTQKEDSLYRRLSLLPAHSSCPHFLPQAETIGSPSKVPVPSL